MRRAKPVQRRRRRSAAPEAVSFKHLLFRRPGRPEDSPDQSAFAGILSWATGFNSSSIRWLTRHSENSLATRMAFLIALAFDRPWQIMHTPRTPSNGAPPYSE